MTVWYIGIFPSLLVITYLAYNIAFSWSPEIHYNKVLLYICRPNVWHGCSRDIESQDPRLRHYSFRTKTRPRHSRKSSQDVSRPSRGWDVQDWDVMSVYLIPENSHTYTKSVLACTWTSDGSWVFFQACYEWLYYLVCVENWKVNIFYSKHGIITVY